MRLIPYENVNAIIHLMNKEPTNELTQVLPLHGYNPVVMVMLAHNVSVRNIFFIIFLFSIQGLTRKTRTFHAGLNLASILMIQTANS